MQTDPDCEPSTTLDVALRGQVAEVGVHEKTYEQIIKRYPREAFPDIAFDFVDDQRRLPDGNILDLILRDADGLHWVVELKRDRATVSAVEQVARYAAVLVRAEPHTQYRAIVVAPTITPDARSAAIKIGVEVREVPEAFVREIAARHGLALDHATGHRPRPARSRGASSTTRAGTTRAATSPELVDAVRNLNERFPPGSLTAASRLEDVVEYWDAACPAAPEQSRKLAAEICLEVMRTVAGSALGRRAGGRDPYTLIDAPTGQTVAAIEAKPRGINFSFHLPMDLAKNIEAEGVGKIHMARGYSAWMIVRGVGGGMTKQRALELFRRGAAFEFEL